MNQLKNKHVTRLGYPTGRGGALYYVSDQEGLRQMAVDLEIFQYLQNGVDITPQLESQILNDVKFERDNYNSKVANHGVPDRILALLQITEKSKAHKYCKNLTISEFELFLFIQNCHLIGFAHKSKFPEYVPDHLLIADTDTAKLKNGDTKPISKKLGPLLKERRHINIHLFYRDSEWHCFFFSYDDIVGKEKNHWKNGSHLHYVSFLWPNYTKEQVWDSFDARRTQLSGNLHIRFNPYEYPELKNPKNYPASSLGEKPGAFAFDLAFASDCGSFPIPSAHVATRGCWITNVSTMK
jgi:hypothetical protein